MLIAMSAKDCEPRITCGPTAALTPQRSMQVADRMYHDLAGPCLGVFARARAVVCRGRPFRSLFSPSRFDALMVILSARGTRLRVAV
jgi:hypothetical protein